MWRKLRRLGAVQLIDGLVALPQDARTREQLEWIADEVIEAGGEATVWLAEAAARSQERELARRMSEAIAKDYDAVIEEAQTAAASADPWDGRSVGRLRRELRRIRSRDFFPTSQAEAAQRAVDALAEADEEMAP